MPRTKRRVSKSKSKIDALFDNNEIMKYAFLQNRWLWAHLAGGAILGKILIMHIPAPETILAILIICVVWEIFEYIVDTPDKKSQKKLYGSVKGYWLDTTADILGAVLMAILVVL